jgi:signal transduction histidine kinase
VLLGSVLVNLGTALEPAGDQALGVSLLMTAGIGAGAAVQAVLGASLVRRWVGWPTPLYQDRQVFLFALFSGPVSCLANATVASVLLALAGRLAWQDFPFNWWTWWVGDTMGVLVFAPVILVWFARPRAAWRERRLPLTISMLVTFAFSVLLFVRISSLGETRIRVDFVHRCETLAMRLQQHVTELTEDLVSVTRFYASSVFVDEDEFRVFVRPILADNPEIRYLSWHPQSDSYAPVYAESPVAAAGPQVADLATRPASIAAVQASSATGEVIATPPFSDESDGRRVNMLQLVVMVPAAADPGPGDVKRTPPGCLVMGVKIDRLLGETFGPHDTREIALEIRDEGNRPVMGEARIMPRPGQGQDAGSARRLSWTGQCIVGGRTWALRFRSGPVYMEKQTTWQAWYVMASALLFTALLEILILLISGRTEQIREVVEERTAELKATTRELERSNRDLEQFGYATSHDLQEPLRTITGFLQIFVEDYGDKVDKKGQEYIDFVVDGANRMKGMINALLTYSRVGTRGCAFESVDLEQTLAEALKSLQLAIEESGAQVTHGPLPAVDGDPNQLNLLLQNLVGNAIKFRGDKIPAVHVSASPVDGGWEIAVKDNGIGIDPEYRAKIFEVFQRLHSHDKYPGTGIGLALCRRIVERHGGHIRVESLPGQGATFLFTLMVSRPSS